MRDNPAKLMRRHRQRLLQSFCLGLMLFSLWRAPLPWLHRHSSVQDARLTGALLEHLHHFHSGTQSIDGTSCWHAHVLLWEDIANQEMPLAPRKTKHSPRHCDELFVTSAASPQVDEPVDSTVNQDVRSDRTTSSDLVLEQTRRCHPLEALVATRRLLPLYCIALC